MTGQLTISNSSLTVTYRILAGSGTSTSTVTAFYIQAGSATFSSLTASTMSITGMDVAGYSSKVSSGHQRLPGHGVREYVRGQRLLIANLQVVRSTFTEVNVSSVTASLTSLIIPVLGSDPTPPSNGQMWLKWP